MDRHAAARTALRRAVDDADVRLVRSGTAALTLALELARDAAQDRGAGAPWVALPAYGCYDLATAAIGAGLRVQLYDIEPTTLAPDLDALAALANASDCAAIVLVHLYGFPVDVVHLRAMLGPSRAMLVEDAAQGAGGRLHGAPLGTSGDFGVLSFGRGKGIIAGGGGALVSRAHRLPEEPAPGGGSLRAALLTAAQWMLGRPSLYGIPSALPFLGLGETVYKPPVPLEGMTRACAAMLPAALGVASQAAADRGRRAAELRAIAAAAGLQPIDPLPSSTPGWLRCPLLVPGGVPAGLLAAGRRLGVMPAYPTTLAALPQLAGHTVDTQRSFVGASRLVTELITLPCHHQLTSGDVGRLAAWLYDTGRLQGDARAHRL